jgi:polyhydroxyalkanoate synthesis repressor PhaR
MKDAVRSLAGTVPERLIRRYGNRKLYDPAAGRYVTVDELGRQVSRGGEVKVVDQRTGEDLTTVVLAQVLLESLKERTARIPRHVLARLIRLGTSPATAWRDWPGPHEAAARARQEAERIVGALMARGRLTLEEGLALRHEISRSVHRLVEESQRGIEGRLRGVLDRVESGLQRRALRSLEDDLDALDEYLSGPPPARRRRPGRRA